MYSVTCKLGRKRSAIRIACVIGLMGLLSASDRLAAQTAHREPLRIGFLGPLSGPTSTYGVPNLNGIKLAIDEANETGELGRKIELIVRDDRADAATSATLAQELVSVRKVDIIFGGVSTGTAKADRSIIADAGVPFILGGALDDALTAPGTPDYGSTFRVGETNTYDTRATIGYLKSRNYRRICGVSDTSAFGQSNMKAMQQGFAQNGLEFQSRLSFPLNTTDLTSQVLQLRNADCDSIYLNTQNADSATFIKTLKQLSWPVPVIGGRGLATAAFINNVETSANGVIFPTVIDRNRPEARKFITKYNEKYGSDSDPVYMMSGFGHDAVRLLIAGLKASEGLGGKDLSRALETVSITDGVTGQAGTKLSFRPDKHDAPEEDYLTFMVIQDGKVQQMNPPLLK